MSDLSPSIIESVIRGNPNDARTFFQGLVDEVTSLRNTTGTSLLSSKAQTSSLAPPTAAGLTVTGAEAAFTVTITNPATQFNTAIQHQVSYSADASFQAGVTTLPLSTATQLVYNAPATSVFWRVRSTFDGVTFGNYVQASTQPIDSGLHSTAAAANSTPLNQSNFATLDSVAAGSTANVRIYGPGGVGTMFTSVKGGVSTLLPSATVIGVPLSSNPVVTHNGEYQVLARLPDAFDDAMTPVGTVSVVAGGSVELPTVVAVYDEHGHIIAFNVTDQGNGITSPLTFTITDSSGTGATTGAQTIQNGKLISVSPGNPGQGYSGNATVTPSGGVSQGASGGGRNIGGNGGRLIYQDGTI